jgi:hypothetical protein
MGKAFCALLEQSKKAFPVFNKTQDNLERVKPEAEKRFYKTSRIVVLKCEKVSTEGTKNIAKNTEIHFFKFSLILISRLALAR